MTFTITVRKLHLAVAVLAIALIAPATAWAAGVFDDVPDGRFFTDAAEWAAAEGITTGVSTDPPLFAPDENVTRGQTVTFLKRYHDNLVQPGLDALDGTVSGNSAAIRANDANIASNAAAVADTYTQAEVDAAVTEALLGTAAIPSGTTITGGHYWDNAIVVDNGDVFLTIDLPGLAAEDLTAGNVNFAPAPGVADADPTCTGTWETPTAPPGKVCLYRHTSLAIDTIAGDTSVSFRDRSFRVVFWYAGAPGSDAFLHFTWAYTAP